MENEDIENVYTNSNSLKKNNLNKNKRHILLQAGDRELKDKEQDQSIAIGMEPYAALTDYIYETKEVIAITSYYVKFLKDIGLSHKPVTLHQARDIESDISTILAEGVSELDFKVGIIDYLYNLPDMHDGDIRAFLPDMNDGDIRAFLKASKRIFDIDLTYRE